ncbi:Oxidation resistance protein 1 [Neolecta irregularis DAH-3]|uniref:Oxidation resistance protein 1 n=1 Tax=Neolecta irregularis (strain DAH-3) TaxID=1198029 RepID=A0A1U7LRX0_NEOID|nr:Oxidation resistance protein 1 [Neolecta irregularis DAH-3]|eukprot:OLL25292.1 Oxidation resistance protein 1 [Neolecta irregularis DAH-3]
MFSWMSPQAAASLPRHESNSPLPSLSPLTLSSPNPKADILPRVLAEELRNLLPARLQLQDTWELIYSLDLHGVSLRTLYDKCQPFGGRRSGFLLVVKNLDGEIFGAFSNERFKPFPHYFGNGECFLWKTIFQGSDLHRFEAFPYAGRNEYMVFCEHSFLSVGGGEGRYGLWLDDSLRYGVTEKCPAFGNEELSSSHKFYIAGVEVWGIQ